MSINKEVFVCPPPAIEFREWCHHHVVTTLAFHRTRVKNDLADFLSRNVVTNYE